MRDGVSGPFPVDMDDPISYELAMEPKRKERMITQMIMSSSSIRRG